MSNAWTAAKALSGREDADLSIVLAGTTPLQGASAGLTTGLVALGLLLHRPPEAFFATGGVGTEEGDLEGGLAAREKADAAASLAPQRGLREPPFLCPPIPHPPTMPPLRVRMATDLGSAYAWLDPEGYAQVAERHRKLRASGGPPRPGWIDVVEDGLTLWRVREGNEPLAALARGASALVR